MTTSKRVIVLAVLGAAAVGVAAGFVWSGRYNVAADDAHTAPVMSLLQTARERSIAHHAATIEVPDLSDPEMVRQGAGNYAAMCAGCHLAPGMGPTELSRGLYPAPPVLAESASDPAHQFWVIKHGIKATGMPAWGPSMEDGYIWGMVAFLQALPALDAPGYAALVASSEGHSHGGGESGDHGHGQPETSPADPARPASDANGAVHLHADGKAHLHPPGATPPVPAPAATTRTAAPKPSGPRQAPAATPAPKAAPAEPPVHEDHQDHGDHHEGH